MMAFADLNHLHIVWRVVNPNLFCQRVVSGADSRNKTDHARFEGQKNHAINGVIFEQNC